MVEFTHLGKQSKYPQHYNPSVLVAVPRILNREQYGISNDELPFSGFDVWHAYEFSFLLKSGIPVVGILKIVYPCDNPYLVESKSLKLYLNSFNMDCFGRCLSEGIEQTKTIIRNDLEKLLKCKIEISFYKQNHKYSPYDFSSFDILEELLDLTQLQCNTYTEDPSLLEQSVTKGAINWGTHLLRSNCKITNQPDWGSLFIKMKGSQIPTQESFLKYIVSLRNENHFHEEICEMVFKRLLDKYSPDELMITCKYTRRGGIDINPIRCLPESNYPTYLSLSEHFDPPSFRQ